MTKQMKIPPLHIVVSVLLVLVILLMCVLMNMSEPKAVPVSSMDVTATLPGNDEITRIQGDSENLILINKTHGLDPSYEPEELQLLKYRAGDRDAKYQKMCPEAADAFDNLAASAKKEGVTIVSTTAYRPYDYQKKLHESYLTESGKAWTEKYSAKPGYSEHQTGLATDVSGPSVNYRLTPEFAKTAEGKWLLQNAHKYGFIIRYPEDKEDITGYEYEPWHIRYVGVAAATEMHNRNLTLEEYLGAE